MNDERLGKILEDIKFKKCEDTFSDGNYNFELFQYALEKVFEEERKIKEEEKRREEASRPKVSFFQTIKGSNYSGYFSILLIIFSLGIIGAHYKIYSSSNFNMFK